MNWNKWKPKRSFREWKRRDQVLFIAIISILVFHFAIGLDIISSPLYVNVTPSAPLGVYIKSNEQELIKGAYVLVFEHDRLQAFYGDKKRPRYLLKHIAGIPGDTMVVTEQSVSIDDDVYPTLSTTSQGLSLPHLPLGDYILKDNEYFVANHPEKSYDSRYFGPVKEDEIQAVVTPIWLFGEGVSRFVTEWEQASNH